MSNETGRSNTPSEGRLVSDVDRAWLGISRAELREFMKASEGEDDTVSETSFVERLTYTPADVAELLQISLEYAERIFAEDKMPTVSIGGVKFMTRQTLRFMIDEMSEAACDQFTDEHKRLQKAAKAEVSQ